LMGQKITAQMAHDWGAVNEVLPSQAVMERLGDRQVSPPLLAHRPAPHPPDLRPGVQARRGQRSRFRADHGAVGHDAVHPVRRGWSHWTAPGMIPICGRSAEIGPAPQARENRIFVARTAVRRGDCRTEAQEWRASPWRRASSWPSDEPR
jgi:hypothetical protein